jgi:signal transduction histidine kinase/ligand-binding sensor domain-containing protein
MPNMKQRAAMTWWRLLVGCLAALPVLGATAGHPAEVEYVIASWETVDGLPENSATAVAQTPDGYLWFGTFNGLVRFNGIDFTVFNPDNTPELPSVGIVNVYADRRGRLWISTYEGLLVRDGESWRQWLPSDGWTGDYVRTFTERDDGGLFLTTFNGKLFEWAKGRFAELPAPPGDEGAGYLGCVDEEGQWWAVQNQFIGRWENGRWVSMVDLPELANDSVGCAPAREGGMWLLLGRELRKLRRGLEVMRIDLPEAPGGIWSLSEDSRGNVWIATYNHGFCRVAPDGTMTRWNEAGGMADSARCAFEDREGNLWLGTSGHGLARLIPKRFRHFELMGGRSGLVVQSVSAHPGGGVWAASYGHGLFHVTDTTATNVPLPGIVDDIPYLQSVLADDAGQVWIGTLGDGLRVVSQDATRLVPPEQTAGDNIIALFKHSGGDVWVSGGGVGAARFDGKEFRVFGTVDEIPPGFITGFAEDAAGAVWLTDGNGVFRQQPDPPFAEVRDAAGQSIRRVTCLTADADGSMWLGSSDRGLLRWKNGGLFQFDEQINFPVTVVNGFVEDGDGYLWMTSGHRIVRAHRNDLHAAADGHSDRIKCRIFDASDGLPKGEFIGGRQPTCARDIQGRLWFATIKGLVMIDPSALTLNDQSPPVHVESISYHRPAKSKVDQRTGRRTASEIQSHLRGPFAAPVSLPPGSRRIEIKYAGLSYSAPEKMRFEVKLEGNDSEWRVAGDQRAAHFHELPARNYVFRVRASNNDGVWNETGASLAFTVLPFYWQTWWFRIGVALLLVGLGGAGAWWQSRSQVRRALERERTANEMRELAGRLINAQEDERRRIARELHDDFSQRLALLSVEMELAGADSTGAPAESAPRLGEMATRVKDLSSEVHRMAYELHPAKLDQLGLVAAARGFCRELAKQSGVRIEFEPGHFPRDFPADVALCLYRIIQESLQNVVRHSGAPEARVELQAEPGQLRLVVSDSGQGFDTTRAGREGGLGLSSMQERIRLVRGAFSVDSRPGQGTRIEVRVPLTTPI